ncbi:MAG: hypothetical protein NWT08_00040 [Akkermansiaceae bacterium]|jgi:hypothetical protein|nr:hypothetical protein [Akkermansiaceae bacterium]MDP4645530.1 hypothetical protein [Akkermansiaceae bacterium]MDP4719873.1 hypothetical protein [Akkermansiaceae bacterium]MDP4778663.1 hypothetical protein [Akkermansiaceae bacterium]MDP4848255.1 hypothetical protein [Akkermansiaceae bacterium]
MQLPHYLSPLVALAICISSASIGAVSAESDHLITAGSAGGVEYGMTVDAAQRMLPGATFERDSGGEGRTLISVVMDGKEQLSLYAGEQHPEAKIDFTATIKNIEVTGSGFETAEGVKVGMSASDVESKIGKLNGLVMNEIEAFEYANFSSEPPGMIFRLWSETGTAGVYADGERTTTTLSEGAKIHSIIIVPADVMFDVRIGGIGIGFPEEHLLAMAAKEGLGELVKGEDVMWEAIGEAVQSWNFKANGLSVDMASANIGGKKSVNSITIEAPSKLKTERGIGIGSTKGDVEKAYGRYPTDELDAKVIAENGDLLIGSLFGGMIFGLDDGKVTSIFLGASAE